ncbi:hypothetical protein QTP86_016810 [Hemibagrus guttatus]|nr:hypothetical protein QTP86_016810 [Hemibagrus guttatus]
MLKYLNEALAAGVIQPSSSPVGAGFFFVGKKDGGLRPCIDYRGLNQITIKNRYLLPLIFSAFELLQDAVIFSKLELCNLYHLVRICKGDEWNTAFNTPSGHYELCKFEFQLSFWPGSKNIKADTLSRSLDPPGSEPKPEYIVPRSVRSNLTKLDIEQLVLNAHDPIPSACLRNKLYVPDHLHAQVLQWCHSSQVTCHPGTARTRWHWSHTAIEFVTGLPPSDVLDGILQAFGHLCQSSGYHSQSNGQTDHMNWELETGLRLLCSRDPISWPRNVGYLYALAAMSQKNSEEENSVEENNEEEKSEEENSKEEKSKEQNSEEEKSENENSEEENREEENSEEENKNRKEENSKEEDSVEENSEEENNEEENRKEGNSEEKNSKEENSEEENSKEENNVEENSEEESNENSEEENNENSEEENNEEENRKEGNSEEKNSKEENNEEENSKEENSEKENSEEENSEEENSRFDGQLLDVTWFWM